MTALLGASVPPGSGGTTPHTQTFTSNGTATWPAGTTLSLHGIGGSRVDQGVTSPTGWGYSGSAYGGLYVLSTDGTYSVVVPASFTGSLPSSTDLAGSGLSVSGSIVWNSGSASGAPGTVSWTAGGIGTGLTVQSGSSSTGWYTGVSLTGVGYGGCPLDMTPQMLNSAGAVNGSQPLVYLESYTTPLGPHTYTDGATASIVVNGATKTFAGQLADGTSNYTDYSVSSGASTSGAVTVPAGGSVTVTYYT